MTSAISTDAGALIEAVQRLHGPELKDIKRGSADEAQVLLIPSGKQVVDLKAHLDKYLTRPERKKGKATLTTLVDFNGYTQRHMTSASAVFCDDTDKTRPRLVTVFDAHHTQADWQEHRAEYAFPLSDEWMKWSQMPEWMSQADFAAFIEDRITDVIDPSNAMPLAKKFAEDVGATLASPAKLLELSRGLSVHVDSKMVTKVNLGSGEAHLMYKEDHNDESGQPLKVPGAFVIAIPVFRLGPAYSVPVRVRYRAKDNRVTWNLSLQRIDHVFENAIAEAAKSVAEVTSLPVFRGKPE